MAVVPLTLAISLCLAFTFIIFFLCEHARGRLSSAERDSLLPLAEESSRLAHAPHDQNGREDGRPEGARPSGLRRLRRDL